MLVGTSELDVRHRALAEQRGGHAGAGVEAERDRARRLKIHVGLEEKPYRRTGFYIEQQRRAMVGIGTPAIGNISRQERRTHRVGSAVGPSEGRKSYDSAADTGRHAWAVRHDRHARSARRAGHDGERAKAGRTTRLLST